MRNDIQQYKNKSIKKPYVKDIIEDCDRTVWYIDVIYISEYKLFLTFQYSMDKCLKFAESRDGIE
jgi:hypothetical protein